MEVTVTYNEARELLTQPGYDAYGKTRLYGIKDGYIDSIKSLYQLEKFGPGERLYTFTHDGVPIRKA